MNKTLISVNINTNRLDEEIEDEISIFNKEIANKIYYKY
jgi:hypothetical protein